MSVPRSTCGWGGRECLHDSSLTPHQGGVGVDPAALVEWGAGDTGERARADEKRLTDTIAIVFVFVFERTLGIHRPG
ncbi:hypothetical protein [Streptomyces sp. NPDC050264]|uniref:hypothetical protein n=1 Tax=Streptomyces sp. NPDC050264 TaxID=3155038 RepID=UPI0034477228